MTGETGLHLVPRYRAESTVATLTGAFTEAGYRELRDDVLKLATGAPESVIADIHGLDVDDDSLMSVFTVIALRIGDWPGLPFAVVTGRAEHAAQLAAGGAEVPVHAGVLAAEQARGRPSRRRAVQLLAASAHASATARAFVGRTCAQWNVRRHVDDALLVATELVENAILHTTSHPRLRLELRPDTFTIAVADDDPRRAVLRERPRENGLGLRLVDQTAHRWGCSPSWGGGKAVWAVLRSNRRGHPIAEVPDPRASGPVRRRHRDR
ncbi:MAG TPA: ATP-binding protein [Amycolatopsis sp.]|uniref:ATP-binding protein n=1 Tax=Amycolatopsis nalaikhensis TaxID=715472 RepID=A0ABY8XQ70_9PSEU|nr:ATP-binding protein [Amycolatopsis sp. 2-2]WIV57804.1 ATP-binding protein [Amycolatopsis sp. 2-2]